MLTVQLPFKFDDAGTYRLISQLIDGRRQPIVDRVAFDFTTLGFIDAVGVVSFTNIIEWLRKRGVRIRFSNYARPSAANQYLDSFGFFEIYLKKKAFDWSLQRSTTMSLRQLHRSRSHAWLEFEMVPWVATKLNIPPASLADIKTCFQEIFNNIIDHSGEETGCVHVQWHPNKNTVRAAVSDFGVGIPNAMGSAFPGLRDHEAILRATEEGVTSKRGRNLGAGLDVLIRNVVGLNRGQVCIRSNEGACYSFMDGERIAKRAWSADGFYPGTLVDVTLRTDTIAREEPGREDLEWF